MGRPRKPAAVKARDGNPGKRKVAPTMPAPAGVPAKPAALDADAAELWDRIIAWAVDMPGLLTPADAPTLELICRAWQRFQVAQRFIGTTGPLIPGAVEGTVVTNPAVRQVHAEQTWLLRALAEIGLTPAGRAKLDAADSPPAAALVSIIGALPPSAPWQPPDART